MKSSARTSSSASENGVLRSLRGSSQDGSELVCFFSFMSCSGSVSRLFAPVAEQAENEEKGRLLWMLGCSIVRNFSTSPMKRGTSSERRLPHRAMRRREAVRLVEGREDGMLVQDGILVHRTQRRLGPMRLASHACGRLSLMSGMPVRNTASLQWPA